MVTQLVPSIGAILLTMTTQTWQNTLQNSSHWALETLCIDTSCVGYV